MLMMELTANYSSSKLLSTSIYIAKLMKWKLWSHDDDVTPLRHYSAFDFTKLSCMLHANPITAKPISRQWLASEKLMQVQMTMMSY